MIIATCSNVDEHKAECIKLDTDSIYIIFMMFYDVRSQTVGSLCGDIVTGRAEEGCLSANSVQHGENSPCVFALRKFTMPDT